VSLGPTTHRCIESHTVRACSAWPCDCCRFIHTLAFSTPSQGGPRVPLAALPGALFGLHSASYCLPVLACTPVTALALQISGVAGATGVWGGARHSCGVLTLLPQGAERLAGSISRFALAGSRAASRPNVFRRWLQEMLQPWEWVAVALAALGTLGLGATAEGPGVAATAADQLDAAHVVAALGGIIFAVGRSHAKPMQRAPPFNTPSRISPSA
jgi:hypothetical protein